MVITDFKAWTRGEGNSAVEKHGGFFSEDSRAKIEIIRPLYLYTNYHTPTSLSLGADLALCVPGAITVDVPF